MLEKGCGPPCGICFGQVVSPLCNSMRRILANGLHYCHVSPEFIMINGGGGGRILRKKVGVVFNAPL